MKKLIALFAPAVSFLALPLMVLAQAGGPGGTPGGTPGGEGGFGQLITLAQDLKEFVDILVVVVITVALLFFFWGLALFILSAGDEEKRAQGKKVMLWGIIALTVIVAIWGLVTFLAGTFGVDVLDQPETFPGTPGLPPGP